MIAIYTQNRQAVWNFADISRFHVTGNGTGIQAVAKNGAGGELARYKNREQCTYVLEMLISAIDAIHNLYAIHGSEGSWIDQRDAFNAVNNLTSTQPEAQWIPCSETVDIPDHEVMACDRYGEFIIGYLDCKDEQWLCESDGSLMYDPVAWCELPKPYKEGGVDG